MNTDWEEAVVQGDAAKVNLLLARGVDVNARDSHGQTALMRAALKGDYRLAGILVEHGADLDVTAMYNLSAFWGRQVLLRVSFIVIAVGGSGVWLLGRSAVHIGASGLVFGYFGYLVARGWYERRLGSILLAIAVIILYGGLILGVLPARGLVSWEAHLFGLIAGILAARSHRR